MIVRHLRPVTSPRTVGGYRIVQLIGQGGMGSVFEAVSLSLQRRVALKVLNVELDGAVQFRRRFQREALAAARVAHPHVVTIFDAGVDGEQAYIAMELLRGEDLRTRLKSRGPMALRDALDILLPVFDAVGSAHRLGIVHRDLKPGNLFLESSRPGTVCKVLDFGIARIFSLDAPRGDDDDDESSTSITRRFERLGSWRYMSPESFQNPAVTPASDQFALAVILHHCITGRLPFQSNDVHEHVHALRSGQRLSLEGLVPPLVDAAIGRALALEPERRFVDVWGFGRALLPFAGDSTRVRWRDVFAVSSERGDAPECLAETVPCATRPLVAAPLAPTSLRPDGPEVSNRPLDDPRAEMSTGSPPTNGLEGLHPPRCDAPVADTQPQSAPPGDASAPHPRWRWILAATVTVCLACWIYGATRRTALHNVARAKAPAAPRAEYAIVASEQSAPRPAPVPHVEPLRPEPTPTVTRVSPSPARAARQAPSPRTSTASIIRATEAPTLVCTAPHRCFIHGGVPR